MSRDKKETALIGAVGVATLAVGYSVTKNVLRTKSLRSMSVDLKGNESLFNNKELNFLKQLQDNGQSHLIESWDPKGTNDQEKRDFIDQLQFLNDKYPGGLFKYIDNARQLLRDSKEGKNPLSGYTPEVPQGKKFDYGSEDYIKSQNLGLQEAARSAYVIVAGGLGERLGYQGIKLAIPVELTRGESYIQFYFEHFRAIQKKSDNQIKIPVLLMTSDDTHSTTLELLEKKQYFGLDRDQVYILKQEKVACLGDNEARLSLDPNNKYALLTKPHGHGDIHALLYQSGFLKRWERQGIRWVSFLQDTNGLVFSSLLPALAQSAQEDYDFNSCAVPRKGKEQVGAICTLKHEDGSKITCNVEYNQLDPLLRSTTYKDGDVNDSSGYSPFPGNINQLVIKLGSYIQTLDQTRGSIQEFVNPKYKDDTKTTFKSPTRLECMMQDYAKSLGSNARVGFTVVNQVWASFSPVKNNPQEAANKSKKGDPTHSATAGEFDMYNFRDQSLKIIGANIPNFQKKTYNGITVEVGPKVTYTPDFSVVLQDLKQKIPSPKSVQISPESALVIDGDNITIKSLQLQGALIIQAIPESTVEIEGLKVNNKGWQWENVDEKKQSAYNQEELIKGFRVNKIESLFLNFDAPGNYRVGEDGKISEVRKQPALQNA